jgi:pentatricopeptide repeat protein
MAPLTTTQVPLTVASCNALADACIRCGQPARALKLFRDFLLNGGAPLELRSYNIMIKAHREMGQLEGALSCMRGGSVRHPVSGLRQGWPCSALPCPPLLASV